MIGLHLMIDGITHVPVTRKTVDTILCELPGRIGMKILAGPVVVAGHDCNPGWTGFVVIDKSHIAIHTFTEGSRISIDVYSCQSFDANDVERFINSQIRISQMNKSLVNRTEA